MRWLAGLLVTGILAGAAAPGPLLWAQEKKEDKKDAKEEKKTDTPAPPTEDLPQIIPDETAAEWFVERFAGSSTAGPDFFQGPAREVGGLGRCGVTLAPDGTAYIGFSGGIARVSPDGILRLVVGGGGGVEIEGPPDRVCAGSPLYNPAEKMLYLTGPNCIRRLVVKPDGSRAVELVAGTPRQAGQQDGPAKTATFKQFDSLAINSKGVIFVMDFDRLRKIENGEVTTLNGNFRGGKRTDGPLAQARFNLIGLGGGICVGDDDDTLYVADHWNFCVRRIDLKNQTVTTVAGMAKPAEWRREKQTAVERRYNANSDGPALTYGSFNSGCCYAHWDPVHKALWCGGPDESRFRWLKEGALRTVIGAKGSDKWARDGLSVPAAEVKLVWNSVMAVDEQGRAYLGASSDPNGIWRAFPKK